MKIDIPEQVINKWGVYRITNTITGDIYIGSTTETFSKRSEKHISEYKRWKEGFRKRPTCPLLYEAFNEYNSDNFIMTCEFFFNRKKDSITNKGVATYIEERLIEKYDPVYNVCRKPTLSGCPNLGRKLPEKWRYNIAEKSKLYKHKDNVDVYNKKSKQNKELSSIYRMWKEDIEFIGSLTECSEFTNYPKTTLCRWMQGTKSMEGWHIQELKNQKKGIRLFINEETIDFNSFGECDKFLNMWRGFTSTKTVNKSNKLLDYRYELL